MSQRLEDLLPNSQKLRAGESLTGQLEYDDYPRSAGWALTVYFSGEAGTRETIACAAGTTSDSFAFQIKGSTTASWTGGMYSATVTASKGDDTEDAERLAITILPNPTAQTQAQAILAAINATILGAATDDQLTTSIDGITLRYWMREQGLDAMLKLQNRFQQIVQNEIRRQAGHGGIYAVQHHAIEDTRLAGPWFAYPPPRLRA